MKKNNKQKLEALLAEAASSQELASPDDALSRIIEKYKVDPIDSLPDDPMKTIPDESSGFQEFLASIKKKNKKSS